MNFQSHIIEFLGLQDVVIEDIKRSKKKLSLEVKVRQKRSECYCKHCGLQFDHVKEWSLKKLKGAPIGPYSKVTIKFMQMRGFCDDCKRSSVAEVDWIHPQFESMTCCYAETAGRLMEEITCEGASRILHTGSKEMWKLDQYRMNTMLQYMKLPDDLDLSYMAADEVHFRTLRHKGRRGLFAKRTKIEYVTNLVAPLSGKVLFNAMGRDSEALESALSVLSEGRKMSIEKFAVDMHDPFIAVIKTECPNAQVVIDRFHLAQKVNETFDKIRKSEFKLAKQNKDSLSTNMLEPHRRFILIAKTKHLSKAENKLLDKLRKANESIHAAMLLTEYFHKALDKKTVKGFREVMIDWYQLVRESNLKPFKKLAKTIRKYRKNIEGYITSRLTTAVAEGLNNKIKVLKRMGYGYSSPISFCRKILQRCGYLNHLSINTDKFMFSWPDPA